MHHTSLKRIVSGHSTGQVYDESIPTTEDLRLFNAVYQLAARAAGEPFYETTSSVNRVNHLTQNFKRRLYFYSDTLHKSNLIKGLELHRRNNPETSRLHGLLSKMIDTCNACDPEYEQSINQVAANEFFRIISGIIPIQATQAELKFIRWAAPIIECLEGVSHNQSHVRADIANFKGYIERKDWKAFFEEVRSRNARPRAEDRRFAAYEAILSCGDSAPFDRLLDRWADYRNPQSEAALVQGLVSIGAAVLVSNSCSNQGTLVAPNQHRVAIAAISNWENCPRYISALLTMSLDSAQTPTAQGIQRRCEYHIINSNDLGAALILVGYRHRFPNIFSEFAPILISTPTLSAPSFEEFTVERNQVMSRDIRRSTTKDQLRAQYCNSIIIPMISLVILKRRPDEIGGLIAKIPPPEKNTGRADIAQQLSLLFKQYLPNQPKSNIDDDIRRRHEMVSRILDQQRTKLESPKNGGASGTRRAPKDRPHREIDERRITETETISSKKVYKKPPRRITGVEPVEARPAETDPPEPESIDTVLQRLDENGTRLLTQLGTQDRLFLHQFFERGQTNLYQSDIPRLCNILEKLGFEVTYSSAKGSHLKLQAIGKPLEMGVSDLVQ
ncbi:hypothetical protein EBR57_01560 [bacterium]|nr:hypothetical protein [bacterium]